MCFTRHESSFSKIHNRGTLSNWRMYVNIVMMCAVNYSGTAVSLMVLAAGFLLSAQTSPPVTFHPNDPSLHNSTCITYGWVLLFRRLDLFIYKKKKILSGTIVWDRDVTDHSIEILKQTQNQINKLHKWNKSEIVYLFIIVTFCSINSASSLKKKCTLKTRKMHLNNQITPEMLWNTQRYSVLTSF